MPGVWIHVWRARPRPRLPQVCSEMAPSPLPLEPDFMCGQPPKPALSAAEGAVRRAQLDECPKRPIPHFLSSPQTTLIPPNSMFPIQIYFPIPFRFTPPNLIK
jgi:hypothetical protein